MSAGTKWAQKNLPHRGTDAAGSNLGREGAAYSPEALATSMLTPGPMVDASEIFFR